MMLLVEGFWPGLVAGLLLGLGMGALAGLPRERVGFLAASLPVALLAILSGLALLQVVPGEAGLWIETGALMLVAYLAGCLMGGLGRTAFRN